MKNCYHEMHQFESDDPVGNTFIQIVCIHVHILGNIYKSSHQEIMDRKEAQSK